MSSPDEKGGFKEEGGRTTAWKRLGPPGFNKDSAGDGQGEKKRPLKAEKAQGAPKKLPRI